ncbi:MAG TPA: DUF488 family protein [Puia sp.]|jgi:uncharacterized protein YeaO (DUF488 family)|nr:DUF488 family protein [Puia sp.]
MYVKIKRVYEEYDKADGYRMLVDRLWPRGIKKENAKLNEWNKDIAPSTELRKKFHNGEENFQEFVKSYKKELLENNKEELQRLKDLAKKKKLTLLYGSKDEEHNHAKVLVDMINSK